MKSFDIPQKGKRPIGKFVFGNPYGFFTNLQDSTIREEYESFKKRNKIPYSCPLDNELRHEFDTEMKVKYKKEFIEAVEMYMEDNKNVG